MSTIKRALISQHLSLALDEGSGKIEREGCHLRNLPYLAMAEIISMYYHVTVGAKVRDVRLSDEESCQFGRLYYG